MRAARGSSPRVRGTLPDHQRGPYRRRFIPACAGNAGVARPQRVCTSVHPRVCGERDFLDLRVRKRPGSSPRVRGTRWHGPDDSGPRRFIPACAGNAPLVFRLAYRRPVHPRVCGERAAWCPLRPCPFGSSPRVRGTRLHVRKMCAEGRFIPACAGNACAVPDWRRWSAVHPRVCGERLKKKRRSRSPAGSSPRVRGTRWFPAEASAPERFIPACAGNASARQTIRVIAAVHPRVCGERRCRSLSRRIGCGSSPRVRGTRHGRSGSGTEVRFIPACAGNASCQQQQLCLLAVHPRVCGERRRAR